MITLAYNNQTTFNDNTRHTMNAQAHNNNNRIQQ